MTEFVSAISGSLLANQGGNVRVTGISAYNLFADKTNSVRVSWVEGNILYANKDNAVRVSYINAYVLMNLVEEATPKRLDSGSIGSLSIASGVAMKVIDPSNLEPNPYKPTLPSDVTDGMSPAAETHASTQQEIIRKQHNLTQGGDTTFPWDLIQQSTSNAQFNLGSVGKFFTPEWGIVHAVYVQFKNLKTPFDYGQMPYGRLAASPSVDWEVTNDLTLSGVELAVGIGMMTKFPNEGDFGWLVIRGGTIASLQPYDFESLSPGDVFTWGNTGTVIRNGLGTVLARVWGTPKTNLLDPGDLIVDVGGLSPKSIKTIISADLTSLQSSVANLQTAVANLQNAPQSDYSQAISKLQQAVQLLNNALARESATRSATDTKLQNMIGQGQITVGQFNDYKAQVAEQLDGLNTTLSGQIRALNLTLIQVKGVTDQLDPAQIKQDILNLQASLNQIVTADPVLSRFPVVTGDVPPVFVYLDDGNLVYVEN